MEWIPRSWNILALSNGRMSYFTVNTLLTAVGFDKNMIVSCFPVFKLYQSIWLSVQNYIDLVTT
jgi:hypothetical protein